jgi:hypothetical protein
MPMLVGTVHVVVRQGVGMNNLYVYAPIPRPALWIFSSNSQPPPGYMALASAAMHRRRRPGRIEVALTDGTDDANPSAPILAFDAAAVGGDLARLLALFARMEPEQRSHIVEFARQMLEAEGVAP